MNLSQLRYAAGVKDMLERHFKGEDFPEQNYIVKEGQLASQYRWSSVYQSGSNLPFLRPD